MAEEKKSNYFLDEAAKALGKKAKTPRAKVTKEPKIPRAITPSQADIIAQAVEVLQSLGFKIEVPSTSEDAAKRESSLQALGFTTTQVVTTPKELRATLYTRHIVGGEAYGPGEVILTSEQSDLYRSLLDQDRRCAMAHRDTTDYVHDSQCYIITKRQGADQRSGYSKSPVSEEVLKSNAYLNHVSVSVGKQDIAGYNPSGGNNNSSF